ncbi:hypothetical protein MNBD_ACTINO02-2506 [hydrothermal vent metagenome]|uniref:Uncharacterized protein n=1 Tax=hydrothermal vent metagenome TaxID=652676 RepID=A0A3B0TC43_9ZZZZ
MTKRLPLEVSLGVVSFIQNTLRLWTSWTSTTQWPRIWISTVYARAPSCRVARVDGGAGPGLRM